MTKHKAQKPTKKQLEARAKALAKGPPALKHGGYSKLMRKRYSDKRTIEGRQLAVIMGGLVDDLGGNASLTARQRLLLDTGIRPKLITLMCIAAYIDKQIKLVDEEGNLLKVLNNNYIAFSNALRLDLLALSQMAGKAQAPDLEGYLKGKYGGAKT
jgi:hypothetical protein